MERNEKTLPSREKKQNGHRVSPMAVIMRGSVALKTTCAYFENKKRVFAPPRLRLPVALVTSTTMLSPRAFTGSATPETVIVAPFDFRKVS